MKCRSLIGTKYNLQDHGIGKELGRDRGRKLTGKEGFKRTEDKQVLFLHYVEACRRTQNLSNRFDQLDHAIGIEGDIDEGRRVSRGYLTRKVYVEACRQTRRNVPF